MTYIHIRLSENAVGMEKIQASKYRQGTDEHTSMTGDTAKTRSPSMIRGVDWGCGGLQRKQQESLGHQLSNVTVCVRLTHQGEQISFSIRLIVRSQVLLATLVINICFIYNRNAVTQSCFSRHSQQPVNFCHKGSTDVNIQRVLKLTLKLANFLLVFNQGNKLITDHWK